MNGLARNLRFIGTLAYGLTMNAAVLSLQVLHEFQSPGPIHPGSGVVRTSDGSLYGTTPEGNALEGGTGYGTVYRITPDGQLSVLTVFDGANGYYPAAGLVEGMDGRLYGTARSGGPNAGWARIFAITPDGIFTNIFVFHGTNGYAPEYAMTLGKDGSFYGTTVYGGAGYNETNGISNGGAVFKVSTAGEFTLLNSFTGTNGFQPMGRLVQANNGRFYGTTAFGGQFGFGTVFSISTEGEFRTILSFDGTNGKTPVTGLIEAESGGLYGMTEGDAEGQGRGMIFKISTNGILTTIAEFNGANGRYPSGSLAQGDNELLYGVTKLGGAHDGGTIFSVTTNGAITTLVSFEDGIGRWPTEISRRSDGNFYGTTAVLGGPFGAGTVFRLAQTPEIFPTSVSNGVVRLSWSAFTGGVYQVEYRAGLDGTSWSSLSGRITATGNSASFEDSFGPATSRYYRVTLLAW